MTVYNPPARAAVVSPPRQPDAAAAKARARADSDAKLAEGGSDLASWMLVDPDGAAAPAATPPALAQQNTSPTCVSAAFLGAAGGSGSAGPLSTKARPAAARLGELLGWSPLHRAAFRDRADCVRVLVEDMAALVPVLLAALPLLPAPPALSAQPLAARQTSPHAVISPCRTQRSAEEPAPAPARTAVPGLAATVLRRFSVAVRPTFLPAAPPRPAQELGAMPSPATVPPASDREVPSARDLVAAALVHMMATHLVAVPGGPSLASPLHIAARMGLHHEADGRAEGFLAHFPA